MTRRELVAGTLDAVIRHAGLQFKDVRLAGAEETIGQWLDEYGISNPSEIGPGSPLDALLEDLVVHESYFDRDIEQLRLVDELVLTQAAGTSRPIHVWSAGCANGEEPYTLAFMLASRGLLPRARILATDLSRPALARARVGRYRAWAVRTGANSPAMRHLVRSGDEWAVPERIKTAVEFRQLNLVDDPFPTDQDLVVCRNVLIYLDPAAVEIVARKFATALAPNGWLFVAPSDPRLDAHAPIEATVTERGVYYRHVENARAKVTARIRHLADSPPSLPTRVTARPCVIRSRSLPSPPSPKKTTHEARDLARTLADRGDLDGARRVLTAAISSTPLDPELHFLDAVLLASHDVDASLASLDRAIYLGPDAPLSYLFAARLRQSRGDHAGARRSYARALQLLETVAPEHPVLWSEEPAWLMADACRQAMAALQ